MAQQKLKCVEETLNGCRVKKYCFAVNNLFMGISVLHCPLKFHKKELTELLAWMHNRKNQRMYQKNIDVKFFQTGVPKRIKIYGGIAYQYGEKTSLVVSD